MISGVDMTISNILLLLKAEKNNYLQLLEFWHKELAVFKFFRLSFSSFININK